MLLAHISEDFIDLTSPLGYDFLNTKSAFLLLLFPNFLEQYRVLINKIVKV